MWYMRKYEALFTKNGASNASQHIHNYIKVFILSDYYLHFSTVGGSSFEILGILQADLVQKEICSRKFVCDRMK